MITLLVIAATAAYLFWPAIAKQPAPALPGASDLFRVHPIIPAAAEPAKAAPDGRAAIDSLLAVRERMAATESLDDSAEKAIDTLWLGLLHGSEKR